MAGNTQTVKGKFYVTFVQDCPDCRGTGSTYTGLMCPDCNGTGTLEDAVELTTALTALGILPRLDAIERTAGRAAYYSEAMANGGI